MRATEEVRGLLRFGVMEFEIEVNKYDLRYILGEIFYALSTIRLERHLGAYGECIVGVTLNISVC